MQQVHADVQPLLHTAGVVLHTLVGAVRQPDDVEHVRHPLGDGGARKPCNRAKNLRFSRPVRSG